MTKETTKYYTEEELKTGFKDWNTRIIEVVDKDGVPALDVNESYAEWWRTGPFHAQWNKDTVERLVDYLKNWLERVKDLPDKESTDTAKRLGKQLQKIG